VQAISFQCEGGESVRELQLSLSRISEQLLHWFDLAMRISVLRQHLKELVRQAPPDELGQLEAQFERIKW